MRAETPESAAGSGGWCRRPSIVGELPRARRPPTRPLELGNAEANSRVLGGG
jgi:hypothetical protein